MAISPDDLTWLQKLTGKVDGATAPFGGAGNLGLALLANSGYSATPRSFGQVLGASALQGQQLATQKQQAQQEQAMDDLRKRYMEAQIGAMQGKPEGYTLSPGQVRYDASGKQVSAAPAAPDNLPSEIEEYKFAQQQGYKGTLVDYQLEKRRSGAVNVNLGSQGLSAPPTGYARPNPLKPGLIVEPGGPADPANKPPPALTEGDKKNRVLYSSLVNSERQIEQLGDGADTGSIKDVVLGKSAVTAPLQSEEYKNYEAAGLRWAANLLYLKSGATANPDEIRSTWKQFFPQPGDGQKVKDAKKKARKQEISAIGKIMAGETTRPAQIFMPGEAPQQDPLGILSP